MNTLKKHITRHETEGFPRKKEDLYKNRDSKDNSGTNRSGVAEKQSERHVRLNALRAAAVPAAAGPAGKECCAKECIV